jgi:hypothetical protein
MTMVQTDRTVYRLVIPAWRPATVNELFKSVRARIGLKKRDRLFVTMYARAQGVPLAFGPRRVSLCLTLPAKGKAPDPDNLWKSLLDALTSASLLVDDDAGHCQLGPVTFSRGPALETAITLEDLDP